MIKKTYNRILDISDDHKQITLPDSRYYRRNGEYYPSVTYVLNSYPKGRHFEDWLKKVGYSADWIVKKASQEGTAVHLLIEKYFEGKEVYFVDMQDKDPSEMGFENFTKLIQKTVPMTYSSLLEHKLAV